MKKKAIYFSIIILALLHQDFWFWDDPSLVFGFLPVGLAYHALYSVLAGLAWFLVLRYVWPSEVEQFASGKKEESSTE